MMPYIINFILLVFLSIPFFAVSAVADTFYYKQESGVFIYTNQKPKQKGFKSFRSKWARDKKSSYHRENYGLKSYEYSDRYDHLIQLAAEQYGLDPKLVKAMIKVESNFYPGAVSSKGAMGVMQLMPKTAERMGVANAFDPMDNIFGGSKYYRFLLNMFNHDHELALAGYNAGENAVIKYGYNIPPYRETQNYVRKVFDHYNFLKNTQLRADTSKTIAAKREMIKKEDALKNYVGKQGGKSISYKETLDSVEIDPVPKKSKVIVESVQYLEQDGSASNTYADYSVGNGGEYTVQIASFPQFESAREMEESLKSKTYPAYIRVAEIPNKGTFYRVRIGEFTSRNQALLFAENLQREQPYIKSAYVTTIN